MGQSSCVVVAVGFFLQPPRRVTLTVALLSPICCEGPADQEELTRHSTTTHTPNVLRGSRKIPHWCCLHFPGACSCARPFLSKCFQRFNSVDSWGGAGPPDSLLGPASPAPPSEEPTPGAPLLARPVAAKDVLGENRPVPVYLVPTSLSVLFLG